MRRSSAGTDRLLHNTHMSYTVLARKWRPRSFAEMTGQEHVLRALSNALDSGRLHHAFLFTGTRGVGKTTVARILAKCLNCERGVTSQPCGECSSCREIDTGRNPDVLEVDAASQSKVDETRELLDNVPYAPAKSRFKVYLIDEVHMLSTASFNALLKTLEEPPPHVKFLLATTDPQKLPPTVLSRCLQFNLKNLSVSLIAARLKFILEAEQMPFEPAALQMLAAAGDGSLRDALSLLDQLLAFGGGRADEAGARAMLGTVDREQVQRLAELLASGELAPLMSYAQTLEDWSPDYERMLVDLAGLLERVALVQALPEYVGDELYPVELLRSLAQRFDAADVQLYYQTALLGRRDLQLAPDPRSGFRMTLLRMLVFRPAGVVPGSPEGGAGNRAGVARAASPVAAGGKAAATAPTLASAPPRAPSAGGDLDWPTVLASLDLSGMAKQLAQHCSYLGRSGGVVRLALDARMNGVATAAQIDKLSQALSGYLGETIRVAFEKAAVPAVSPARQRELDAENQQTEARTAFAGDPGVLALQQQFGATIHADSVRPLDKD
jgi:DNA polymerase-3 subunit gamma/tau